MDGLAASPGIATREVRGFSPWPAERIAEAVRRGEPMASIPGDFVFRESGPGDDEIVASSPMSALPYFHSTRADGRLVHGPGFFEVAARSGRKWKWNDRAVACLGLVGHTVGEDTLHADVRRLAPDTVLRIRNGRASFAAGDFWTSVFSGPRRKPRERVDEAVEAFQSALADVLGPSPFLSLSAGFDSRLLLAGMLRAGIRPVCVTTGRPESTDVVVANAVAKRFQLEHRVVELRPEEYLSRASEIVRITGGTKTAAHWHTYLYLLGADLPAGATHYAGANGEFARTYYLDRGIVAQIANLAPESLLRAFMALKFLGRGESRRLKPLLLGRGDRPEAPSAEALERFLADSARPGRGFLDRLDAFYATQRVRHFIGNGLALYNAVAPTRSPFLDARWLGSVARLPRTWKLGSRWHRETIFRLCPELLDFPVAAGAAGMGRRPSPFYWLRRPRGIGYSPFRSVIEGPGIREMLRDSSSLDHFADRGARAKLLSSGGVRAADFLLTMHFVVGEIRKQGLG